MSPNTTKIQVQFLNERPQTLAGEFKVISTADIDKITPGLSESIIPSLTQNSNPFEDYFIFQDKQKNYYVFKTDAGNFSLGGRSITAFKTIAPIPDESSLVQIIDHETKAIIDKIDVKSGADKLDDLLPYEKGIQETVQRILATALTGKDLNLTDYQKAMLEVQSTLASLLLEYNEVSFEKTENGHFILHVQVKAVPLAIKTEGLPEDVQKAVQSLLAKLMLEVPKNLITITTNPKEENEYLLPHALEAIAREPSSDFISYGFSSYGKDGEKVGLLPLPASVIQVILQKINILLNEKSGLYSAELAPQTDGIWMLKVNHEKHPKVRIRADHVAALMAATGIDLSNEMKELDKGTTNWSRKQMQDFLDRLVKKYAEKGFDLHTEAKGFVVKGEDDTLEMRLDYLSAQAKPSDIIFEGNDFELPGFPSKESLLAILFQGKPFLPSKDFPNGLKELVKAIDKAGYILAPINPSDPKSGPIVRTDSGKIFIATKVARMGKLSIESPGVTEESLKALETALAWKEGEPFKPRDFGTTCSRAMNRLQLASETEPEINFSYENETFLDVKISIKKPQGKFFVGMSYDGTRGLTANANISTPHTIPNLASSFAGLQIGIQSQSIQLGGTSLPLTESGVSVSAGLSFQHGSAETTELASSFQEYARLAFDIPLGKGGVASPLHLHVPLKVHRIDNTGHEPILNTGTGLGLSYGEASVFLPNDYLTFAIGQNIDRDFLNDNSDTTTNISTTYRIPLESLEMILKVQAMFSHRIDLSRTGLPLDRRYLSNSSLDLSAVSKGLPQDTKAIAGIFLEKPMFGGAITPFLGITAAGGRSLDGNGLPGDTYQTADFGGGIRLDFIGGLVFSAGYKFIENGQLVAPGLVPQISVDMMWNISE